VQQKARSSLQLVGHTPDFSSLTSQRAPSHHPRDMFVAAFERCFEPFDAARLFYNLSVWETIDDELRDCVYRSAHVQVLRSRHEWIEPTNRAQLALSWIPASELPTIAESAARLKSVDERGVTPYAFSFAESFACPPWCS
jgi:hypothetical protein